MVADAKLPKFLGGRPVMTFVMLTIGITAWWIIDQRLTPANFGRTLRGTVDAPVSLG